MRAQQMARICVHALFSCVCSLCLAASLSFYHQSAAERETVDTWLISKEGGPLACDINDAIFLHVPD